MVKDNNNNNDNKPFCSPKRFALPKTRRCWRRHHHNINIRVVTLMGCGASCAKPQEAQCVQLGLLPPGLPLTPCGREPLLASAAATPAAGREPPVVVVCPSCGLGLAPLVAPVVKCPGESCGCLCVSGAFPGEARVVVNVPGEAGNTGAPFVAEVQVPMGYCRRVLVVPPAAVPANSELAVAVGRRGPSRKARCLRRARSSS